MIEKSEFEVSAVYLHFLFLVLSSIEQGFLWQYSSIEQLQNSVLQKMSPLMYTACPRKSGHQTIG